MDALEELINALEPIGQPDSAGHTRAVIAAADLDALRSSVLARPQPWFFHAADTLTVFATRAQPGTGSAPHDHGLCAVIACLEGREGSRRYELDGDRLVETGIGQLDRGDVHLMPVDAIHAVFNCWDQPNLVLHVYGGNFLSAPKRVWDPITGTGADLGLTEPLAHVPAEATP